VRELVGMSPLINNIPAIGKGPRRLSVPAGVVGLLATVVRACPAVGPRPRRGNHSPTLAPAMWGMC